MHCDVEHRRTVTRTEGALLILLLAEVRGLTSEVSPMGSSLAPLYPQSDRGSSSSVR
jgi:hypothetical protein